MKYIISAVVAAIVAFGMVSLNHPVGAVASPVMPFNFLDWGGVQLYQAHGSMKTATTTLCAMESPDATSTVTFGGWSITTGTSTASKIDIGLGKTAFATTSVLVSGTSVSSGATGAAAYAAPNGTAAVIGPNTYVLVKTDGAGVGGYTFTGTCDAQFTVL